MQTDNLQKATLRDPEVSAICNAIYESRVRFRACVFSLIDLAHEHIYRVHASDIRVDIYPGTRYTRTWKEEKPYAMLDLAALYVVEMFTVREK